jgi:hypothetical protein
LRAWLAGLQGNISTKPLPGGRTSRQTSAGAQAVITPAAKLQRTGLRRIVGRLSSAVSAALSTAAA